MVSNFSRVCARLSELRGTDSVSSFARKVGINQQTMDTYIKGRIPPLDVCIRIATTFGVTLDWLAGLSDDRAVRCGAAYSGDSGILLSKIHDLEIEVATLKNALSIVGGRPALAVKTGGSIATKTA